VRVGDLRPADTTVVGRRFDEEPRPPARGAAQGLEVGNLHAHEDTGGGRTATNAAPEGCGTICPLSNDESLNAPAAAEANAVPSAAVRPSSGSRSGLLLGIAALGGIALNYLFLLGAGRLLGSADYGEFAAIVGLLTVLLIPSSALQMAVSREISRMVATHRREAAAVFAGQVTRVTAIATLPLVLGFIALSSPVASLLSIDEAPMLALAGVSLVATFLAPVALGIVQGAQRFGVLAAITFAPFVVRVGVLAVAALVGWGLVGAIGAVVISTLAGLGLALAAARPLMTAPRSSAGAPLRPFLTYLGPVVIGLIGVSILTNADILVVKARFSDDDAGIYAAASAFARVAYFLPATILAVVFPRTAARQARGEDTSDILGRSLLVTAGFCSLLALFYVAVGDPIVSFSFGSEFDGAGPLLPLFAVEMMLLSLANVLVGFHLSRGENRYAWIVGAGVALQIALLVIIPTDLHQVILVNIAVGVVLLVAHEVFVGSSVPALRAGTQHFLGRL
jgi:O-antigen/teichoic acid export membrane protein